MNEGGIQGVKGQKIDITGQKITVLSKNIALVSAYGEANTDLVDRAPITRNFSEHLYMKKWMVNGWLRSRINQIREDY